MKLEDYLLALENCPDELVEHDKRKLHRLTVDHGVYDNFPAYLRADFDAVKQYFSRGRFRPSPERKTSSWYVPGTVVVGIRSQEWPDEPPSFLEPGERQHHLRQKESGYNVCLMLHPYQKKKVRGVHFAVAMARVIREIGDYALREEVPLCFPSSVGWRNIRRLSEIVYYP